LITYGKRIGNLSLYSGEPNAFNESTIEQYSDLANNLAYGVTALRTREALRESEQRLQDIVDNTTAVIFVKDLELRYILVNREYERRHLVPRDQIRGKSDFDIHPHDVAEAVRANDRQVIEAGMPIQFEESVPSAEGDRCYLSAKFLLRDRTGKAYAVCGVATDITQLKRAEAIQGRRARQAAMRADIQLAFSDATESGLQTVLQRSAEAVVRHLDAAFARIWTLNEQENMLELQASAGQYIHLDGEHARIPVGELKIGLIARERKPHLTNDVQNDDRISHPEWAKREGMQAFAGHPLIVEGRLVGVLGMFARNFLEPDTLEALASIADTIAQGIDRKLAAEKIRERALKLSRANEVLRRGLDALARDQRLQSFVDQVLVVLTEQLGGHSSTLWLIDVQQRAAHLHSVCQDGRVVVAEDSDHPNAHEPRYWSSDDPGWIALQMKRPFLHNDPVNDPQLLSLIHI